MGRKRIHESDSARANAWTKEKTSRVLMDVRDDAPINKAVIQKAADTCGMPLARFLAEAVAAYILSHDRLGEKWLEENGNHAPATGYDIG